MKTTIARALALLSVASLGLVAAAQDVPERFTKKLLSVGSLAPTFELPGFDGKKVNLGDLTSKHKATVVFFWFQGCVISRNESRALDGLYDEFNSKGMAVVGVNQKDDVETIGSHVKPNGISFPIAMNGEGPLDMVESYGALAFPTTYVIDGQGKIVLRFIGFDDDKLKQLKEAVAKLGVAVK
jgi:peroxiredoxin